jgi:hypothetical protein
MTDDAAADFVGGHVNLGIFTKLALRLDDR